MAGFHFLMFPGVLQDSHMFQAFWHPLRECYHGMTEPGVSHYPGAPHLVCDLLKKGECEGHTVDSSAISSPKCHSGVLTYGSYHALQKRQEHEIYSMITGGQGKWILMGRWLYLKGCSLLLFSNFMVL